jgi:hypothetical protein
MTVSRLRLSVDCQGKSTLRFICHTAMKSSGTKTYVGVYVKDDATHGSFFKSFAVPGITTLEPTGYLPRLDIAIDGDRSGRTLVLAARARVSRSFGVTTGLLSMVEL